MKEWLKRGRGEETAGFVRAIRRKKSDQWAVCLGNALRIGAARSLEDFHLPSDKRPSDPLQWPWLGIVADQGSAGACNVEPFWDPSHRGWNCVKAGVRSAGLWCHMILHIMAFNSGHGPWQDDMRFQLRDVVEANLGSLRLEQDDVFQLVLLGMLADADEQHMIAELGIQELMRERLKEGMCWYRKFDHVSTNRFFGALRRFRLHEDKLWHSRLYGLMVCCLELGLLSKSSVTATLRDARFAPLAEAGSRSTSKAWDEARVVKAAAQNTLHMTLLVYGNVENQWRQRIIGFVAAPVEDWHSAQNRLLRDAGSNEAWLYEQCASGYANHHQSVAGRVSSPVDLTRFGLEVRFDNLMHGFVELDDAQCAQQDVTSLFLPSESPSENMSC